MTGLRPRVLCVDDEPYVLEGMRLHLRRAFEVATATSGAAALDLVSRGPPFAVIVSKLFGLADPRSFCIQKALQNIAHGAPIDENLMFAGHSAYLFGKDPFYSNGFVPTVKQLVDRILTGD